MATPADDTSPSTPPEEVRAAPGRAAVAHDADVVHDPNQTGSDRSVGEIEQQVAEAPEHAARVEEHGSD